MIEILMKPLLLLCAGIVILSGCTQQTTRPAMINHVVFFQLNDPAESDALIADCADRLASIHGVVSYFCGQHVDTGRATVDSEYDVGLYVGFNSFETYAGYVEHPDHQGLVADWGPRIEKLLVRDVLDEGD